MRAPLWAMFSRYTFCGISVAGTGEACANETYGSRHLESARLYLDEYAEFDGHPGFLNAKQNYTSLRGTQSNTYKCFITNPADLASSRCARLCAS